MLVPDKLMTAEPAFILYTQDVMCRDMQEDNGCAGIDCEICILNAELKPFSKWLIKQLEESMK